MLDDFLVRRGRSYAGGISSPLSAQTSCSRLSPFLAFGALSMRTVWQASEARRRDANAALAEAANPRERAEARDVARRHGSRRDRRGAMRQDPVRRSLARDAAANTARPPQAPDPQHRLPFATADSAVTIDATTRGARDGNT